MEKDWIVLNITLPQKPSRVRVSAWRRLKAAGAANIGQSAWVLPFSEISFKAFKDVSGYADENGGKAFIMRSEFMQIQDNKSLEDYFNDDRDKEYWELLEQCDRFFVEIKTETEKKNFSFAELEENEQELEKLQAWFNKIEARDFFVSKLKSKAEETLVKCKADLDNFAENIYNYNESL